MSEAQVDLFTRIRLRQLTPLFENGEDLYAVSRWLGQLGGKRPIVFVGAGFSKNARGGGNMPLWQDVSAALRKVFGSDEPSNPQDPLRVAEEAWTLDRNACIRRLRALVPGEALHGSAHRALFRYPVEAVVTTNMLDTLLDACAEWHRVLRDSDLPLADDERPPLLYIHGHDSEPERWVFSVSDYLDLSHSRRAMFTRISSLMAERPILLLGVGLQDPTFDRLYHELLRQLGEMRPRSLAIGITPPSFPQRQAWEKKGLSLVTIATTATGGSIDRALARFLDIRPDFGVSRTITHIQLSGVDATQVLEALKASPSFEARVGEFEQCIQERVAALQPKVAWPENDAVTDHDTISIQRLWLAVAQPELDDARWQELNSNRIGVLESLERQPLKRLPDARFRPRQLDNQVVRVVDDVLSSAGAKDVKRLLAVARWCRMAAEEFVEHSSPTLLAPLVGISAWCTAEAARVDPEAADPRRVELGRLKDLARRFDLVRADGERDDVREVDFASDFRATGMESTASPSESQYLDHMRAGASELDDQAFEEAVQSYESAFACVESEPTDIDAFRRWLALEGRVHAAQEAAFQTNATVDPTHKQRLETARQHPHVVRWRKAARTRERGLLRLVNRELREATSAPGWDGFTSNNARYLAWRTFRDLQEQAAPPGLQVNYCAALLDAADELADDLILRHRLELPVRASESRAWLRRRTDPPTPAAAARQTRDRALVHQTVSRVETYGGLFRRLEVFPSIAPLVVTEDLGAVVTWLDEALGGLKGARWDRNVAAAALDAVADLVVPATFPPSILQHVHAQRGSDDLARSCGHWPWYRWARVEPDQTVTFLSTVFRPGLGGEDRGRWLDPWHDACVSVFEGALEKALSAAWVRSALRDSLKTCENEDASHRHWFHRRLLQAKLATPPDRLSVVARACEDVARRVGRTTAGESNTFAILDDGAEQLGRLADLAQAFPDEAFDTWKRAYLRDRDGLVTHAAKNLHNDPLTGCACLLGEALASSSAHGDWARAELLELLDIDPRCLGAIPSRVLQPSRWNDEWTSLLDRVHRWAAGDHRDDRGRLRVHLLQALVDLHRPLTAMFEAPHSEIVEPLLQLAVAHAADSNRALASASAAAFFRVARTSSASLPGSSRVVLECLANDPRVSVRRIAAYGCTRLVVATSPSGPLLDAAGRVSQSLESDPYCTVAQQVEFARAEPPVFPGWLD